MSAVDDSPREPARGRLTLAGAIGASLLAGATTLAIFAGTAFGLDKADLLTGATLLGLLAALAALPARRAALGILALVAVWLAGYAVYRLVPDAIELPVPVSDAVGGAAYYISSYADQQVAAVVLIAIAIAVGVIVTIVSGRREGAPPAPEDPQARSDDEEARPAGRRVKLVVLGSVALVSLTLLPDLQVALVDGTRGPLPGGWDDANLIAWDSFQQQGLTAMRDYWYPYGATWLLTDFPTGPVVRWLWQAALLSATGWALWRLVGPKPVRIALCLLALVAIGNLDRVDTLGLPFVWRYLPAFVVAVCYAAVGPLRHRRPTYGHLVFAAVCAMVGAVEADVLLAGLGGAAFVGLGELVCDRTLRTRATLRAAVVDLLPVGAAIAFTLLFWALTHSFSENLEWFTGARVVSASSAAVQGLFGALVGLGAEPSQVTLMVTIPALTLVVAFLVRAYGGAEGAVSSRLLLAASGVATVILAKHLVRPTGPLVGLVPLLALVWTAIVQWRARAIRTAIAAGAVIGAVLGTLQAIANVKPSRYLARAVATPVRAVDDLALVLDRGKVRAAGNGRFAPSRFDALPEKVVIADKLGGALSGPGDNRFATLGDAQVLYVLFGQRPPGLISLYDGGPIAQERRWIDSVRSMGTKLLVWRRDLAVDSVPYHVRAPLVFAYAIANFNPTIRAEPMDVLRLRRPGERPAESYWRARLGPTVELGGIPSYSRGDDIERCDGGPGCVPYAIVTRTGSNEPKVAFKVDGTPYSVSLSRRSGVDTYAVRLDRLWFWPFARGARKLSVTSPGWKVERVGVKAGDDLY